MHALPNFEDSTDEELAKLAQGDVLAFRELIERYEAKLKRYILRISSFSPEESEEILQEVFINIWKNLRSFNVGLSFSSWAYRIARNHTISSHRKHVSRGRDQTFMIDADLMRTLRDDLDVEQEVEDVLIKEDIAKKLKQIQKKYRDVLILKYLEEKSYDEIGDILKKPPGTVATLLHRAKKAFKKVLESS